MLNRRELLLTGLGLAITPPEPPTLWLIGDSTVRNNTKGQQGWGSALTPLFDATTLKVTNKALGGRSSRTFLSEGLWDAVVKELKKGDTVVMQFGHNDGGDKFKGTRPRASLKGNGDETETGVVEATGKEEIVHSYGWYLRKYSTEAKAKGAMVVVCTPGRFKTTVGQLGQQHAQVVDADDGGGGVVDARREGLEGDVDHLPQAKANVLLDGALAAQGEAVVQLLR